MSNTAENNEFLDRNIESTYEELTKVVNAKNDIKSFISSRAEEFIKNEIELEELQDVLHNIRIKTTSNPILQKLNLITEEDAILQRKLAEGIYLELPDLSSRLDLYQENFSKFSDECNRVQKLHSAVAQKLESKINIISSLKGNLEKKNEELMKTFEIDGLKQCQELRDNIKKLSERIAEEKNISKSLSYEMESKRNMLEKLSVMNQNNLTILFELGDKETNQNGLLNEKEVELDKEIIQLTEKANELGEKWKDLKQQKNIHQTAKKENLKILDSQQSLLRRKDLFTSVQSLKTQLTKKMEELRSIKENILIQETNSAHMDSKLQLLDSEINDITDRIHKQKDLNQEHLKDEEEIHEKKIIAEKNMKEMNDKLSILLENKNKEEFSIEISTEKEKFLISEINKLKENIGATELVVKELNEKISIVQNEIDENTKTDQGTPSYEEVDKENSVLDLKIRRYIKAIEICKRDRAATVERKRAYKDCSDSSQDSMLLPKKKK